MVKRELSDTESKMCEKNLVKLADELEFYNMVKKELTLAIELAPIKYKKQVKDMEVRLKEADDYCTMLGEGIENTQKQIVDGVEMKDDKNNN